MRPGARRENPHEQRMNRQWHARRPMPRNATRQQRIDWHREHQQACGCRPAPASIAGEIAAAEAEAPDSKPATAAASSPAPAASKTETGARPASSAQGEKAAAKKNAAKNAAPKKASTTGPQRKPRAAR